MGKNKNLNGLAWLWLSSLVVALDQITKHIVLKQIAYGHTITVLPFLNWTLRFNTGAAFSFLGDKPGWQIYLLASVSVIVSTILLVWLSRLLYSDWVSAIPVSLLLGGALGNLVDRLRLGYVVDFIDFHLGSWHFATFNVADIAVTLGAAGLIFGLIYEGITGKS